jgi:ribosome-associated translation inhibitor RaiA
MNIQVNSDRTIDVDAHLTARVKEDATRILSRFETKLTRVEIHLSDIDNQKSGRADKRCLVEVRPAGDNPLTATATTATTESAVDQALRKMQRSLTTFFGRKGRPATEVAAPVLKPKKSIAAKPAPTAKKKSPAKKAAAKKPTKLSPRGPKKKAIFQARRKNQPSR